MYFTIGLLDYMDVGIAQHPGWENATSRPRLFEDSGTVLGIISLPAEPVDLEAIITAILLCRFSLCLERRPVQGPVVGFRFFQKTMEPGMFRFGTVRGWLALGRAVAGARVGGRAVGLAR